MRHALRWALIPAFAVPAWTGEDIFARVAGMFDLTYSLREGKRTIASYESLTSGEGRQFDFLLTITKVS